MYKESIDSRAVPMCLVILPAAYSKRPSCRIPTNQNPKMPCSVNAIINMLHVSEFCSELAYLHRGLQKRLLFESQPCASLLNRSVFIDLYENQSFQEI